MEQVFHLVSSVLRELTVVLGSKMRFNPLLKETVAINSCTILHARVSPIRSPSEASSVMMYRQVSSKSCLDPFEARRTFSNNYSRQTSFFQELAAANAEAARLKAEGAASSAASTEDSRADPGAPGCQNCRRLQRL